MWWVLKRYDVILSTKYQKLQGETQKSRCGTTKNQVTQPPINTNSNFPPKSTAEISLPGMRGVQLGLGVEGAHNLCRVLIHPRREGVIIQYLFAWHSQLRLVEQQHCLIFAIVANF